MDFNVLRRLVRPDLFLGLVYYMEHKDEAPAKIVGLLESPDEFSLLEAMKDAEIINILTSKARDIVLGGQFDYEDKQKLDIVYRSMLVLRREGFLSSDVIANLETKILSKIREIEEFVSYYRYVKSFFDVVQEWRLPQEWGDKDSFLRTFVETENTRFILDTVMNNLDRKVLLIGEPGVGKTAMLYRVLVEVSKIMDIGLMNRGVSIGGIHEERGVVLFADDITRYGDNTILSLAGRGYIIATAREHEAKLLYRQYPDIFREFMQIKIQRMDDKNIRNILLRYLDFYGITFDDNAVDEAVKKADGLPVYIYHLVKDLLIRKHRGEEVRLSQDIIKTTPAGILEYIGDLLLRTIGTTESKLSAMFTLKCMTQLVGNKIHDLVFPALYEEATKIFGEKTDWNAYQTIHDLLVYDPSDFTLKFPHDSWVDALKGKSEIIASLVMAVDYKVDDTTKKEIAKSLSLSIWKKEIENLLRQEEEKLKAIDIRKVASLAITIITNWPYTRLSKLDKLKDQLDRYIGNLESYGVYALEIVTRYLDEIKQLDERRRYIEDLIKSGNGSEALALSEELYNKTKDIGDKMLYALSLYIAGKKLEAKKILNSLDDPIALYNLAVIHIKEKNFLKARELLKRVLTKKKIPEAYWNLALIELRMDNKNEAKLYLTTYVSLRPDDPRGNKLLDLLEG